MDRRDALKLIAAPAVAGVAAPVLSRPVKPRPIASLPGDDEELWREVQSAFTVDRSITNLNNAGVSPAPASAQRSMQRHLAHANAVPPPIALWREAPEQRESIRSALAQRWGVDTEELAITRNATESLHICQHGMDLRAGDEVLSSDQAYPRMINAFRQRERRDGIRLVRVPLPVPMRDPAEVVRRFAAAITPRTRMILCCHMVNLTGQVLPVREICELGEARGIPVVVDGAHALAHTDFRISDLGCSYYGTSLHKWLFAPHGTGLLYVRRDRIEQLWPLFAENPGQQADIRKFEEVGTHPAANFLAIADAIALHDVIGGQRKLARLQRLRDRWIEPLSAHDRVHLNTATEHAGPLAVGAIANVAIDGLDPVKLAGWLWGEHRVLVVAITHPDCSGLRVSPSVYTTDEEIDRFVALIERAMRDGVG